MPLAAPLQNHFFNRLRCRSVYERIWHTRRCEKSGIVLNTHQLHEKYIARRFNLLMLCVIFSRISNRFGRREKAVKRLLEEKFIFREIRFD